MPSHGQPTFVRVPMKLFCFFAGAGASIAERTSPAACATTDHMSREQAMEALTQVAAARQPVKDAVYHYWLDKRKQLGKPLLRRLQAPTNSSDTNPHSCFRYVLLCDAVLHLHTCSDPWTTTPACSMRCMHHSSCPPQPWTMLWKWFMLHGCRAREKINKPLLRNRRRGNDIDSLQKLQTIRQNQLDAVKVVQFLIKRERKKRDIAVSPAVFCSASCNNSTKQSTLLFSACMFVIHLLASTVCRVVYICAN